MKNTKIIIQQANDKQFTYTAKNFTTNDQFISFTDVKGITRMVPLSRLIEVIVDEQ